MKSHAGRSALLLMLLVVGWTATDAPAQSQSELRRENERLKARVEELERQVEILTENTRLLEESLRAAQQGSTTTIPPVVPDPVTIDESVPTASPRALVRQLETEYAEHHGDVEMGDDAADAQRTAYLRIVDRWAKGVNRKYHKPIEWHVRVVEGARLFGGRYLIRLQAVDPETDVRLGDPFDAMLSRAVVGRLGQRLGRRTTDDMLVLKGTMRPLVRVNPERMERGPFDNPRLIGPFAEFDLSVDVQTMNPKPEEKDEGEDEPDRKSTGSSPS